MDDRRVELSLSEQELVDLDKSLDHRMQVLSRARRGDGDDLRIDEIAERVASLGARIVLALKQLRKMPGGGR